MSFEHESKFLMDSSNKLDHKFEENSAFLPFGQRSLHLPLDIFFNNKNHSLLLNDELSLSTNRGILINPPPNLNSNLELSRGLFLPKDELKDASANCTPANRTIETRRTRARRQNNEVSPTGKSDNSGTEIPSSKQPSSANKLMPTIHKKTKGKGDKNTSTVFLRLMPKSNQTAGIMMKLNNYPRLEVKIAKSSYLKKIIGFLKEKWFAALDNDTRNRLNIILYPDHEKWLKHIQNFTFVGGSNGQNQTEVTKLADHYLISDVLQGYNSLQSKAVLLYYDIEEIKKPNATINNNNNILNNSNIKKVVEPAVTHLQPNNKVLLWDNSNRHSNTKSFVEILKFPSTMPNDARGDGINMNSMTDERNPYNGVRFFESARRSNSKSLDDNKETAVTSGNVDKSNNSAFSFNDLKSTGIAERTNDPTKVENDKSLNLNSNRSVHSNKDGVEVINNMINRMFPHQNNGFVSKLSDNGYSPSKIANISKIQIKKKNVTSFEGLDESRKPSERDENTNKESGGDAKSNGLQRKNEQEVETAD